MNQNFDKTTTEGSADTNFETILIFGFDRIAVWLDIPEFPIELVYFKNHCTDIEVHVEQMPYQARWKCRVEIFQPTRKCLRLLLKALGNDIAVLLTYVEIALDFPANSKKQARGWRNEFLASARMRYQRQSVVRDKTTWYFGRRADGDTRRDNVLVVYADRPSKLNNARPIADSPPCLHIEWRATGSDTLSRLGIISLADLIQFDHQRFWNEHIRLYQLPKPTTLGQLLAKASGADVNVSGSALRKRAARWKERFRIRNKFVMHNALRATPNVARYLKKVPFSAWIKETVSP